MKSVALSIALVLMVAGTAWSDNALSIEHGAEVVEQWRRLCHLHAGEKPDPDMAPAFEQLVRRPGRDREFYKRFLAEDYFPMTTFRRFEVEKLSVIDFRSSSDDT